MHWFYCFRLSFCCALAVLLSLEGGENASVDQARVSSPASTASVVREITLLIHAGEQVVVDRHTLLPRLKTRAGTQFSHLHFDEDLKTLAAEFDRIDPEVEETDQGMILTIHLWKKPKIRAIDWVGNREITTDRLMKELDIKAGAVFEREKFNAAFHKLKAYYLKKGFFEAELDYSVSLDEEGNQVTISIEVCEGRSGKIEQIQFVNFTQDEEYRVLKEMVTKKYFPLTSWYTEAGTYNKEAVEQDRFVITNFLQNEGYADASVAVEVLESTKDGRIILVITADRGEFYSLGEITFSGNTLLPDQRIVELLKMCGGEAYSLEGIRKAMERVTNAYGRLGYIDATVDFDLQLVPNQHVYHVHFKIQEGEQFRVGLIRVFGNTITRTSVILHETILTPGEIFNLSKLKATEARLQNIGFFEHVNVYIVKGSESPLLGKNYRDVYIEVEEGSTGNFSAFMGFSTVEELFGGFTITEHNFNWAGYRRFRQQGISAFRGGGEYLNFTTQVGQKSRSYVLSWMKPFFRDTPWTVGFDLARASNRYISKKYDIETTSLVLRAHYDYNAFVRFGVHYRIKNGTVHLHHVRHRSQLARESHIHGLICAVGTSVTYNSTDHPILPTKGLNSVLSCEVAGFGGGDHQFLSLGYLNKYYVPIRTRCYLRLRGDFQFVLPFGDTQYHTMPMDERFFAGGSATVRGCRAYRLGPQFRKEHAPRGGISMQFFSIEFARKICKDFEVFVFADGVHLSKHEWRFGALTTAVGYGTRFKVLASLPQVMLGMGYPVNAHRHSQVKNFFLSFGGNF